MGIFKKGTAQVIELEPKAPAFPQRLVSFTCSPDEAEATLQPVGDRPVAAITATGKNHKTFLVPEGIPGWGAQLEVKADGYKPFSAFIIIPLSDTELPQVHLEREVADLPFLRVNGKVFSTTEGPFTWIGCTDFQLYQKFLTGQDIEPILDQRSKTGFNGVRVLGMCANMFHFFPNEHPNYYAELPNFIRLCAEYGLYVEFTAFADAPQAMPDKGTQLTHWAQLTQALRGQGTVKVELVNEVNHGSGVNRIDTDAFSKPAEIISSHGSNCSGDMPVRPEWDYETFHWNDLPEWTRKCAHNPMEDGTDKTGKPATSNENTRFPDKCSDLDMAYDAAAGAALLCAGATFHSVSGKNSNLWSGIELEAAKVWAAGARSVPLWAQTGFYRRYDQPPFLRVYSRTVPGVGEHIVKIRK